MPLLGLHVVEPSAAAASGQRPMCLTRLSDDPNDTRNRLRVERDEYSGSLIEVVDEQMSSRAPTAQITHINDKLLLTPEDARWLRDALTEILGEEET